jgi:hypothetical protein
MQDQDTIAFRNMLRILFLILTAPVENAPTVEIRSATLLIRYHAQVAEDLIYWH